MSSSSLSALSPLDGRYSSHIFDLTRYFSEFALIRYRIMVEIKYLIGFSDLGFTQCPPIPIKDRQSLENIYLNFNLEDAERVKSIEKQINHDVKAVEYFIKEQLEILGLTKWKEFVHFGLTSQDINNTAIPLSLKESWKNCLRPSLLIISKIIQDSGIRWFDQPMLARTHGQPATPTQFGKEILVFHERLRRQLELIDQIPFMAKFGGATGGFNAHKAAFPSLDWVSFGNTFVANLGLERCGFTTQIEHYDCLAAFFDGLARINTLLIDFCRDIWQYISLDYLKQIVKEGEVGSSAMPHKVNPIDFENAEGNLGLANALFHHFSSKLPISRLQRDLSDSTVLRNLGVPLGHSLVSYKSIEKGMAKLEINPQKINKDLNDHPEVISEAIQTILRREGYAQPYEALKRLSRNSDGIKMKDIHQFINQLEIKESVKKELLELSPAKYLGVYPKYSEIGIDRENGN